MMVLSIFVTIWFTCGLYLLIVSYFSEDKFDFYKFIVDSNADEKTYNVAIKAMRIIPYTPLAIIVLIYAAYIKIRGIDISLK